jgi:trk system potassium uptake protein TrkH
MNSDRRRRGLPPPALLAIALAVTIAAGTVLLRLPIAHAGPSLSWVDAFFTATSAVCVTGLTVVDTGTAFSGLGQAVILVLIQIGGLGVMTIGTTVLLALGQRPTAVVREILRGLAGVQQRIGPRDLLGMVFLFTLVVEAAGAALLFTVFVQSEPLPRALWLAVFHSVSAFCNAGFGLWPDSLVRYAGEPIVNLTVMALIVAGGLGFVVLVELRLWIVSRLRQQGSVLHFTLHSKIVLTATAVAISAGFVLVLLLEGGNVLAGRPWTERLWIAAFQSVTARTAGFNTVDTAALANPTLLVLIFLMFVGGGSGSMAGGIKLTSAAAVLALVYHRLRGNREVRLFGRAIGEITLQRAVVLAILAAILIVGVVCLIEIVEANPPYAAERGEFFAVTFEAVSAFGTVGLSMGITSGLHSPAKVLIILLMFIGRLGPLWLMDFMQHLPAAPPIRHATEELMVG